jgi:hypothetical protein
MTTAKTSAIFAIVMMLLVLPTIAIAQGPGMMLQPSAYPLTSPSDAQPPTYQSYSASAAQPPVYTRPLVVSDPAPTGGFIAATEMAFLKYGQEGGVTGFSGETIDFGMELAPRFEIGYVGSKGTGVRARYWMMQADAHDADGSELDIDTFSFDVEVLSRHQINSRTELETSAGLRYIDFRQLMADDVLGMDFTNELNAFGGTLGIEAKRDIGFGKLYAKARGSILMGDSDIRFQAIESPVISFHANDSVVGQGELGFGYELGMPLGDYAHVDLRLGAEWQLWSNIGIADSTFGGVGNDDVLEDAGFGGLLAAAAITW